jgi:hypothetical protein
MHAVILTPTFLKDAAQAELSEDTITAIVGTISSDPQKGERMEGTGGARKIRFAGRGKGKSGGYRIITYFAGEDIPVFLLALFSKGERDNLSKAERNELRKELAGVAADYRASVRARAAKMKERRSP